MDSMTVSFPIKREYYEKVVSGDKRVEYRALSDHWVSMLGSLSSNERVVFQCGQDTAYGTIEKVRVVDRPSHLPTDIIPTKQCFAVHFSLDE